MKKITKKLTLLLLAGVILFQTNVIDTHLNNNSSDNVVVNPCDITEDSDNDHLKY